MSVDVQRGKGRTITVVPPSPWSSAAAVLSEADGTELSPAPVATPRNATATTVASASDESHLVVVSATGITRGVTLRVTDGTQWGEADAVVSNANGTAITLVHPLPGTPAAGASVRVLDVDVALTSTHTAELGLAYLLDVSSGDESVREVINVVAHPYAGPLSARVVREYVSQHYPGETRVRGEQWAAEVAAAGNRAIRGRLLETHLYTSQYWDPDALVEVGWLALQRELYKRGLRMPGSDPVEWMRSVNFELRDRMDGLTKSATPIDKDHDGELDEDEVDGIESTLLER